MDNDTFNLCIMILASAVSAGWGVLKTSDVFKSKVKGWQDVALTLAVAVVRYVYYQWVRKQKVVDGKLSDEFAKQARDDSRSLLRKVLLNTYGDKVPAALQQYMTDDMMADSLIESAVSFSKVEAKVIDQQYVKEWFAKHSVPKATGT